MSKLYTKTFEYKGQMVNYYNKALQNKDIYFARCGISADCGGKYCVQYAYKEKEEKNNK